MTGYDRDFLDSAHIATRRPLIADRVRFACWLGAGLFTGACWAALGFVVVMLIGAVK